MRSLRRRAIIGGSIWAILSITIGVVALYSYFDLLTQRRFDQTLSERHLQVVIALSNSGADAEMMTRFINDPVYERPYSGRYWQANGPDREILASRSLFDTVLAQAAEAPPEQGILDRRRPKWAGARPSPEDQAGRWLAVGCRRCRLTRRSCCRAQVNPSKLAFDLRACWRSRNCWRHASGACGRTPTAKVTRGCSPSMGYGDKYRPEQLSRGSSALGYGHKHLA